MFMVGAALGGAYALLINRFFPGLNLSPAAYALVAMAAMFGAASRATFTFIIFAFEITRDYNAILPLMLVSVIADGVSIFLMRNSIMTEKLARRGLRIHHEYETDIFRQVTVGEVMETNLVTLPAHMPLVELAEQIARNDPTLRQHQGFPIVDESGRLKGIITRGDVLRAMQQDPESEGSILEYGNDEPLVTYPDEPVQEAIVKMLRNDVGRLPVVERQQHDHLVGYLTRSRVLGAQLRRIEEESVREPGWITRFSASYFESIDTERERTSR
jgi:CBS domain-containing protein